ncbi:porin [Stutzerimonas urumqiensis]|uniref:oligogalacturonate-specific porin KdgM family protein n=1 Tax=Stutzerimonas urumqiensis TaxID=638269 RepID=UPI003BA87348
MKTITVLTVAAAVAVFSATQSAQAAPGFINYRHQFLDDSHLHSDRLLVGVRLENGLGFEGELKYKTGGSREDVAFDNMVGSGHELTVNYLYRINPDLVVYPLVQFDSIEEATTYKVGAKLAYQINDQFSTAFRYRNETRKLDRDKIDPEIPGRARQDQHTHRYDVWLGYAPGGRWSYEYNFAYFDTDYIRYDGEESDYEQNIAFKYKLDDHWRPFVELGDVKVSSLEDDRQMRIRVGIHYSFN